MNDTEYLSSKKLDTIGSREINVVMDKNGKYSCVDNRGNVLKNRYGESQFSDFSSAKRCGLENDVEPML